MSISKFARLGAAVALLAVLVSEAALADTWTGSGPGDVKFTVTGTKFSYDLNPAGFDPQTWTYSATAEGAGKQTLLYDYEGFHAFFAVTVFLRAYVTRDGQTTYYDLVQEGPQNCCTSPSAGFSYSGGVTLLLQAGDEYGFEMGGSNFDANNILRGSLTISEPFSIPTMSTAGLLILILLAGLAAVFYARRSGLTSA